jgi:hypothetical protein
MPFIQQKLLQLVHERRSRELVAVNCCNDQDCVVTATQLCKLERPSVYSSTIASSALEIRKWNANAPATATKACNRYECYQCKPGDYFPRPSQ